MYARIQTGVFFHADFSRVVEACSLSTRWKMARETRWLFASSLRCLSNGRAEGSIGDESTGLAHESSATISSAILFREEFIKR
jgi:hypothetical protein